MLVVPVLQVLESAIADHGSRNLGGYVSHLDEVLSEANLAKFESIHTGVYAFLAFDPKTDRPVAEYLDQDTFGDDAGSHVFAFFTTDARIQRPQRLTFGDRGAMITYDAGENPSYELVRRLLPFGATAAFPGVLVIERFTGDAEPIFVPLGALVSWQDAALAMRSIFRNVESAWITAKTDEVNFVDVFCAALAGVGSNYVRTNRRSMREWLAAAFRIANENAGTIISVLKLVGI